MKRSISEGIERTASLSLVMAAALGLAACNNGGEVAKASPSENAASASAAAGASENGAPTGRRTEDSNDEAAARYREMPAEEFDSLSVSERQILVQSRLLEWGEKGTGIANLPMPDVYGGKNLIDQNPLETPGKNDDPQSAYDKWQFMRQLITLQTPDTSDLPNSALDKNMAKKMMSGAFYYVGDQANTERYKTVESTIENDETVSLLGDADVPVIGSKLQKGKDKAGKEIEYITVKFKQEGVQQAWTLVWMPITDPALKSISATGEPGYWTLYEQSAKTLE